MKLLNKFLSAVLSLTMLMLGIQGINVNAEETTQTHEIRIMHISFDDVYECLYDITVNEYNSAFENSMLADLKKLHEEYGAVFTLNCFIKSSKQSNYDIAKLPSRYKDELSSCADWLSFAKYLSLCSFIYEPFHSITPPLSHHPSKEKYFAQNIRGIKSI